MKIKKFNAVVTLPETSGGYDFDKIAKVKLADVPKIPHKNQIKYGFEIKPNERYICNKKKQKMPK